MKGFKKYVPMALLIASLGLGFNTSCEKKQDFIKINDVKFQQKSLSKILDSPGYDWQDCLVLKVDIKGRDKDGIKQVQYYLDEEFVSSVNSKDLFFYLDEEYLIKYSDSKDKNHKDLKINGYEIFLDETPTKGKHTLKVTLEDVLGNKLENSYIFEPEIVGQNPDDFIRISNVEYILDSQSRPRLKVDIEGQDTEGIRRIDYILDEEPVAWAYWDGFVDHILKNKLEDPINTGYRIIPFKYNKTVLYYPNGNSVTWDPTLGIVKEIKDSIELESLGSDFLNRKHILEINLLDYVGNKTKSKHVFEIRIDENYHPNL